VADLQISVEKNVGVHLFWLQICPCDFIGSAFAASARRAFLL
jgi:hypothetical protein